MACKSKVKSGDYALWGGNVYKVKSAGYIAHPETLLGGRKSKPGYYAMLEPVDNYVEEPDGWINQRFIKKLTKTQLKKLRSKN